MNDGSENNYGVRKRCKVECAMYSIRNKLSRCNIRKEPYRYKKVEEKM
jgi:hypothetical protein